VTRYDADQHVDPMIAQLGDTVKLRPPAVARIAVRRSHGAIDRV